MKMPSAPILVLTAISVFAATSVRAQRADEVEIAVRSTVTALAQVEGQLISGVESVSQRRHKSAQLKLAFAR